MGQTRFHVPAEILTPHAIATAWMLREEAVGLTHGEWDELTGWLEESSANRAAWEDLQLALTTVSENAADPELMAMRSTALASRGPPRWSVASRVAAVFVCVAGVVVGWQAWENVRQAPGVEGAATAPHMKARSAEDATYRTAVGERSTITLPDGSLATLDTDSILQVAYNGRERGVRLLQGQALFEVAKHKQRPFQVYAGDRRITAVGTKFNVRLESAGASSNVTVALLEGVVKVSDLERAGEIGPVSDVVMAAGEELQAPAQGPVRVSAADTDRVASWRSGVLVFDDQPLEQAVREMNRYTSRTITLAPELANLRISGVFKTGDPERFLESVSEVFPVTIIHDAQGAPTLEPKE